MNTSTATTSNGPSFAWIALIAFGIALLSIGLHIATPTTFHNSDDVWGERLETRSTDPVFKTRTFTTAAVSFFVRLGLKVKTAVFGLHTLLLALAGIAVAWMCLALGFGNRQSLGGMLLFMLSFPIMMAQLEPIWTWDDYWLYIFFPLSLSWLMKRQLVPSVVALALSVIAREPALLLLPGWMLLAADRFGWKRTIAGLAAVSTALVGFRLVMFGNLTSDGAGVPIGFNFASALRFSDALFSLLVSLGAVWIVGLRQAVKPADSQPKLPRSFRQATILTAGIVIVVTFGFAYARESRLFVPAAFFLIPCCLDWWAQRSGAIQKAWQTKPVRRYAALLLLPIIGIVMARFVFAEFEYRRWRDGNWVWLGVHLAITLWFVIIEWRASVRPGGPSGGPSTADRR